MKKSFKILSVVIVLMMITMIGQKQCYADAITQPINTCYYVEVLSKSNVTEKMSVNSKKIITVEKGEILLVTSTFNRWIKVKTSTGKYGYIEECFVTCKDTDRIQYLKRVVVKPVALNVRMGPAVGFNKIAVLKKGDTVIVTREINGWYQVELPNKTGYINMDYVGEISTNIQINVVGLNVRINPSTKAKKVAILTKGNMVLVEEKKRMD